MQYKRFSSKKTNSYLDYLKLIRCNCRMIILLFLIIAGAYLAMHLVKSIFHKSLHNRFETNQDDAYKTIWSKDLVEEFKINLGINNGDRNDKDCPYDQHILSAIVWNEQSIDSYVWTYLTLYSLSMNKQYLQPVITQMLREQLIKLFEKVDNVMPVINEIPRKCFELKSTVIIESNMEVNNVKPVRTPYLLAEHGKRWKDVMNLDLEILWSKFRLKKDLLAEVSHELEITSSFIGSYNASVKPTYIGIYIDLLDKPTFDYYKRSIQFMQKYQSDPIFIVICKDSMMKGCEELFYDNEEVTAIRVLRHRSDAYSFALMSICNNTIISNDAGVLHALYNGGDATVYEPQAEEYKTTYIPLLMAEYQESWYILA